MSFAVKAEQRSYISVFVLVGKTSVLIKDLLKQTECLRRIYCIAGLIVLQWNF